MSTRIAIFALFFGVSVLEVIRQRDLPGGVFWLLVGLVFVWADRRVVAGR